MEQQEQSTSATEQQLDDTIESMNGINSAEVELSVPDATDSLFADTTTQASSSVLLNTNGNLGASAVKAIAQLVTQCGNRAQLEPRDDHRSERGSPMAQLGQHGRVIAIGRADG